MPRRSERDDCKCDYLLDTAGRVLHEQRSTLRVRIEPDGAMLTFKGPPRASPMKLREELETAMADQRLMDQIYATADAAASVPV